MSDIIKSLLEFFKLKPVHFVAISIFFGFLLFGSTELSQLDDLLEFAKNYRVLIGGAFVASNSVLIALLLERLFIRASRGYLSFKISQSIIKTLRGLTEDEKQILRFYLTKQTKTNYLNIMDGITQGLESKGIIERMPVATHEVGMFAYNISDFCWKYLNKNRGLLEGLTNTIRGELDE
jgi:hypothetical protein